MNTQNNSLERFLEPGKVYRREMLLPYSTAIDRTLKYQVQKEILEKVGAGLYYYPQKSRFGLMSPNTPELIRAFLKEDYFLLLSWNHYNTLGLGLTQLYNQTVVYNRKRHEAIRLAGQQFDFRRPTKGFPLVLTREFLLVDLMNNLSELSEEPQTIKKNIAKQLHHFDRAKLLDLANQHGKIGTKKFFSNIKG